MNRGLEKHMLIDRQIFLGQGIKERRYSREDLLPLHHSDVTQEARAEWSLL